MENDNETVEEKDFVYIENVRALKYYLEGIENGDKYRSKMENGWYYGNGVLLKLLKDVWTISVLIPGRLETKIFTLDTKEHIDEFKMYFAEIFTTAKVPPYILSFSSKIDDNIYINYELRNKIINIYNESLVALKNE